MKIPVRCNKRCCQARRSLNKRPELYVKWPTCHINGCDGKMYVDEYRLRKGPKDHPPVCTDPHCPYVENYLKETGKLLVGRRHRVSSKGCSGYEDYKISLAFGPRSKHSPIKPETAQEAPF